jgi:hypothetical protein
VGTGARMRNGLIWSRYAVQNADHQVSAEVELPGGTLGDLVQVVSEHEVPNDGDTLVVALNDEGAHGWAHFREGVLYGGWLGEGPGIEWDP